MPPPKKQETTDLTIDAHAMVHREGNDLLSITTMFKQPFCKTLVHRKERELLPHLTSCQAHKRAAAPRHLMRWPGNIWFASHRRRTHGNTHGPLNLNYSPHSTPPSVHLRLLLSPLSFSSAHGVDVVICTRCRCQRDVL